jgi:hypothetical protein
MYCSWPAGPFPSGVPRQESVHFSQGGPWGLIERVPACPDSLALLYYQNGCSLVSGRFQLSLPVTV